jgi:hypothetical protein
VSESEISARDLKLLEKSKNEDIFNDSVCFGMVSLYSLPETRLIPAKNSRL